MARAGDPKARALVLDRLLIVAKRAAARVLLKDPERVDIDQESEDLVQGFVLFELEHDWKLLDDHDNDLSPFDAFAFFVARRWMLSFQKTQPSAHRVSPRPNNELPEPARVGEEPVEDRIADRALALAVLTKVLSELSPRQRPLFNDLMLEQRPVPEIMERFDMTEDAVYQNRKRFRVRLTDALRRLDETPGDSKD